MIYCFILQYYGVNENEIRKALDSVFPVIQCLGQGFHSYKSSVSNFLIIVMILAVLIYLKVGRKFLLKALLMESLTNLLQEVKSWK